ncbi:YdcF family protein [Rhodopirellula sp. P2]|uniref:YdcF family protein n=1 Tax=Rhodopirellula sp. P2 TaxID=2127060 RepID=UPI002368F1BC|nr:YdcF family protein [Rhodopirellula sp. P2]WDQ15953.1 YdcF family protein [Rhodopirellula sp. P2]
MNTLPTQTLVSDEIERSDHSKRTPPSWNALFVSLVVPAAWVLLLVVSTWMQQGFVAGMRCGTDLIQPVGLVWLGMLALAVHAIVQCKRGAVSAWRPVVWLLGFVVWGIVGNAGFANWASSQVESPLASEPHPALEQRSLDRPLDAVVVLGGGSSAVAPGFYELGSDGERVISAAQAYHAHATRAIIVTGSSTDGYEPPWKQSMQLLVSLGVPEEVIFPIEGVNTQAEMNSLKQFVESPSAEWKERWTEEAVESGEPQVGLITSAFHVPRAMRLANNASLDLIPLPCAFRAIDNQRPWVASNLIPRADQLDTVGKMFKETIAKRAGQ